MSPVLEIRDVRAGYDGVAVVRDLSIDVAAGEVVALLGPSGAGKTTTLLTVSQLLEPLGGEINFNGSSIVGKRPSAVARQGLAHVPEERGIFVGLTTRENLTVGVRGRRPDLDGIVDLFPALSRLMNRQAGLLSGGEQQMLAIGRALVQDPVLLMVDELSLGLAPVIVDRLLPVLHRVAREREIAVLIVEQQVQAALRHADRAYVLNHGDLVASGTAAELAADDRLLASSYLGELEIEG